MYSYRWGLFILCSLCSVSEKMRVAVSFLLFFVLLFSEASGDCYNECGDEGIHDHDTVTLN